MKSIYIITFFLFSFAAHAQDTLPNMKEKIIINDTLVAIPSEFYIDGIKLDFKKVIICENNIKDIKLYKGESANEFSGAIGATVIIRKKKYEFIKLSKLVADLINANAKLKDEKNIMVILNGVLIENAENYQIELNPEIKVTIQNYSDDGIYHGGKENKPNTQIIIKTNK